MDFSSLRHRIIFLKPLKTTQNSMGENVPVWIPFKPTINDNLEVSDGNVYLKKDSTGNAALVYRDGKPVAHTLALSEYSVFASVAPMTGREYQESQKIRAETTYKIKTRYFPDITPDMKVLFKNKELDIASVLNVGERNIELQIVAVDGDANGKE